jgi:Cu(I)/Ag(I) efflux system membrane fusion protein
LVTGKRAVVYVAVPGKRGTYEGREISLGPRAGDHYIVNDGLRENEVVVVNGNFKIDSALQILAKPSMMSPEGGVGTSQHGHGSTQMSIAPPRLEDLHTDHDGATAKEDETPSAFREQLGEALQQYMALQKALSEDQLDEAKQTGEAVVAALNRVDMTLVEGPLHMVWMKSLQSSQEAAMSVANATDLAEARAAFFELSDAVIEATARLGAVTDGHIFRFHCPMAFDGRGADWLSDTTAVRNPYYGSAMLTCGSLTDTLVSGHENHVRAE